MHRLVECKIYHSTGSITQAEGIRLYKLETIKHTITDTDFLNRFSPKIKTFDSCFNERVIIIRKRNKLFNYFLKNQNIVR